MRQVVTFLVWLLSFWTWREFFLRWPRWPVRPAHLDSQERSPKSKLARFLSSLPDDALRHDFLDFHSDSGVKIYCGRSEFSVEHGTGLAADFGEFLGAIASSRIAFGEHMSIHLRGLQSCQHVEAFADALRQSGSFHLRELTVRCVKGSAVAFAKCVSRVVLRIDGIQRLHLDFDGNPSLAKEEGGDEFVANLAGPHIFPILRSICIASEGEGMEQLMKLFRNPNSVLEHLYLRDLSSDVQVEHVSSMLASSSSLKRLELGFGQNLTRGYTSLATALRSNRSLEVLSCDIPNSVGLRALLDPLVAKNGNLQCNTTLTKLTLQGAVGGREGLEAIVDMICTNTSLLQLELLYVQDFSLVYTLAVLEALKTNQSLKRIDLAYCRGVGGSQVLGAMMDMLLENHNIEDIGLQGTRLAASGDADYVYSALSKRKKLKLWDVVQGMANANPTSGRVFLCGNPYAGKTQLRLSIKHLKEFQGQVDGFKRSTIQRKVWNTFKTSKLSPANTTIERTHGIEVDLVTCNGMGISIWDMAGQSDYHAFHELVMPNLSAGGSCSLFLLLCNPMEQFNPSKRKTPSNVKRELTSWLRFIASNTRRSLSFRPHVSMIMTHFDHWREDYVFATRIDEVVLELKSQFDEVLEFDVDKSVFKVDGRDESYACGVFDFIKSHLKQLLGRLPKTIRACEDVQGLVALWNANKSKQRLLKWEEFCEDMCKDVEELNDMDVGLSKRRKEFVAISLNDGGHIIYNEKEGDVITNPHWFCHHIIGEFLYQCAIKDRELEMVSANGIMSIEHMKLCLSKLIEGQGDLEKQFDAILGMMIKLHICYQHDASCIMIPSTLQVKQESLSWSRYIESSTFTYVGRRLACQDGVKTMLTLGFFSRLQVSFFHKLQGKNAQDTYAIFQDVIKFIMDGIEVILQFDHGDVDILLRSHHCQDKMLNFLESEIVNHIKSLQEDPTLGCIGVCLIEYILRPACVQSLVDFKHRKNQYIHMNALELEVIRNGVDACYDWKKCEVLDMGYDKVSTLLGGLAWKKLLERRSHHLQEYHERVQSFGAMKDNVHSKSKNATMGGSSSNSLWRASQRLVYGPLEDKIENIGQKIMSKLIVIEQSIQNLERGIERMEEELLPEVCSRIDDLMAFSVKMQKSQIPKLAYLCEIGKRRLLTRLVPGLDTIQLHLMCESIQGFHEVPNQEGCVVHFGTKDTKRFLALISWGLKLVTILTKIGAHVACGMGSMVPNLNDSGAFVALILDTPGILDYQLPMTSLESLPKDLRNSSHMLVDNTSQVERWLIDFLEPKCQRKQDFYKNFKLKKVLYRGSNRSSIAWICGDCFSKHHDTIDELD